MRLFGKSKTRIDPQINEQYVSRAGNTLTIRTETDTTMIANAIIKFAAARLICHDDANVILSAVHLPSDQLVFIAKLVRIKTIQRNDLTLHSLDIVPTDHILFPFKKASKPCDASRP